MASEYDMSLASVLQRGLRPSHRSRLSKRALTKADGFRVKDGALSSIEPAYNPFAGWHSSTWPFPQIIRGKGVSFLCSETQVFQIDEGDMSIWNEQIFRNTDPPHASTAIPSGGPWHMADFHGVWMLFNGSCILMKANDRLLTGAAIQEPVISTFEPLCNTGVYHRGRGLMGGFLDDGYDDAWQDFIDGWASELPDMEDFDKTLELGKNFVWWSSIGGGDLFWMFNNAIRIAGWMGEIGGTLYHDNDRPLLADYMEMNTSGFMPMPWQGHVLRMLPMQDKVVVYGENGVSAMRIVSNPTSTYGLVEIQQYVGVAGRGAVAGDEKNHLYIDAYGTAWLMTPDLQPLMLGYREFFEPMLGNTIVVSHDEFNNEFYISDGSSSYIWSREGLGSLTETPTSVAFIAGNPVSEWNGISTNRVAQLIRVQPSQSILVNDPAFEDLGIWIEGTGWSIADGLASVTANGSQGNLGQVIRLTEGTKYRVTYEVRTLTGDATVTPQVGGNSGTEVTKVGYYSEVIEAGSSGLIEMVVDGDSGSAELNSLTLVLVDDTSFEVTTDVIDFSTKAIKSVQEVEVMGEALEDVQVSVYYRHDHTSSFSQSDWIDVNAAGVAYPIVTGIDFKIAIKGTYAGHGSQSFEALLVDAHVRWQIVDYRGIRGRFEQADVTPTA